MVLEEITEIFKRFAGQEVRMVGNGIESSRDGSDLRWNTPDPQDPTIKAMRKAALESNMNLIVNFPGSSSTRAGIVLYADGENVVPVSISLESAPGDRYRVSKTAPVVGRLHL